MEYSKMNQCLFLLNLVTLVLGEPQVPCFFIFGDSLIDNGNNNYLKLMTGKANYLPYGIDFPAGPTGRFTNGRNIVDIIAKLLGFDNFIPPFANGTVQEILRGVNYGSGGAGILDETGSEYGVVTMNEQLSNHEAIISRIAKLLGDQSAAKLLLSSCIYYVGMGTADYLDTYLPQFYSSNTSYTPNQFAAFLVTHYSNQLQKLYYNGARKVAVIPLGKIGCKPRQVATYGSSNDSFCFETSNDIAKIFDENLQLLINDLNNRLPNAKIVYTGDAFNNASSYGNIKNFRDPCCLNATNGLCVPGSAPCSNRDEYYFWDEFHPTEAANMIDANIAYKYMSPLYDDPKFPIDV